MRRIDGFLNNFTMYRVILYGLLFLAGVGFVYSLFGLVNFGPLNLIVSLALLLGVCYLANKAFAFVLKIPTNIESYLITGLILFFILGPVNSFDSAVIFVIAGTVAVASKYLLVVNKKHIFNPAALALVIIGIIGSPQAQWWIGNKFMFPLVLLVGLLIVRKIRRFHLFTVFAIASLLTISVYAILNKASLLIILPQAITSWPILFLGTIMLTEPLTTPPSKKLQMIYGGIVGVLSGAQFNFGPIFATPELALVLGNIFSYAVSFKYRLVLTLKEKIQIAETVWEFVFVPSKRFNYASGQYLEWTLSHKQPDARGVRRFFTIASSPTEDTVRLGVKIDPQRSSSFKKALFSLTPGEKIYAGQLAGDFILPQKSNDRYVFIAGGIGVTPFRSIIKSLIDRKQKKDIVLFYTCSSPTDFVYKNIFDSAEEFGVKTVYVCSHPTKEWIGKSGRIDGVMIKEEVPDFKNRTYYLSGPSAMVDGYKKMLRDLGIKPSRVITDYFPGY